MISYFEQLDNFLTAEITSQLKGAQTYKWKYLSLEMRCLRVQEHCHMIKQKKSS